MLTIFPLSGGTALSFLEGFVVSNSANYPIQLSEKVQEGKSWYTGDNDCTHLQLHGFCFLGNPRDYNLQLYREGTPFGYLPAGQYLANWGQTNRITNWFACPASASLPPIGTSYKAGGTSTYDCLSSYNLQTFVIPDSYPRYICVVSVSVHQLRNVPSRDEPDPYLFISVEASVRSNLLDDFTTQYVAPLYLDGYPSEFLGFSIYANNGTLRATKYGESNSLKFLAETFSNFMVYYLKPFKRTVKRGLYKVLPGVRQIEITAPFIRGLRRDLLMRARELEPPEDLDLCYGEAVQSAADAMKSFDGNTATLLNELRTLKDTIFSLRDLLKGDISVKNLSNLWLSSRFGLRLTVKDSANLVESIRKEVKEVHELYTVGRGSYTTEDSVFRVKLYADPGNANWFAKVNQFLQQWDLFPSLANVWDVIPYSFVVDWFVDIEGFLSDIDTNTWTSTLNIFLALYSRKTEWNFESNTANVDVCGIVTASFYERFASQQVMQPVPHFSGGSFQPKNLVDGAALIIQRL